MSVFVKICGLRTQADIDACAGADAIGFNFWPRSKRYITPDEVARLRVPPTLRRFGVFVDPSREEVERVLGLCDTVQLHGDETPDFCRQFSYVKALRKLEHESDYDCELLLVDADAPGYGGTGQRADWTRAAEVARRRKILLAGGLSPDNVAEAIRSVRPFGVDVAGGVESAPGVKDHDKIAAFIRAAKGTT